MDTGNLNAGFSEKAGSLRDSLIVDKNGKPIKMDDPSAARSEDVFEITQAEAPSVDMHITPTSLEEYPGREEEGFEITQAEAPSVTVNMTPVPEVVKRARTSLGREEETGRDDALEIIPAEVPSVKVGLAPAPDVINSAKLSPWKEEEVDRRAEEDIPLEMSTLNPAFLRGNGPQYPEALLNDQFRGRGNGEYRRKGEDKTALKVFGTSSIKFVDKKQDSIAAGVELAKKLGWTAIEVKGSHRNKQALWLAASLEGLQVLGFDPKPADLQLLEAARAGREFKGPTQEAPAGEREMDEAALKSGRSVIKANYQQANYSGPVIAANESHLALEFNGRDKHAVVLERERLGDLGQQAKVGQALSVSLRDGQSRVQRIDASRGRGMER